jgi:hypothetical protein
VDVSSADPRSPPASVGSSASLEEDGPPESLVELEDIPDRALDERDREEELASEL